MPTLLANEIPKELHELSQSENGLLGIGPYPGEGMEDPDLINAGKETVTAVIGGSFYDSAESFAMTICGDTLIWLSWVGWRFPNKVTRQIG